MEQVWQNMLWKYGRHNPGNLLPSVHNVSHYIEDVHFWNKFLSKRMIISQIDAHSLIQRS